jgi:hypothetical protein
MNGMRSASAVTDGAGLEGDTWSCWNEGGQLYKKRTNSMTSLSAYGYCTNERKYGEDMGTLRIIVQVLALIIGILAAILWWRASTLKPRIVASLTDTVSGDGDLAMQIATNEILVWRVSLQGTLNAWAAICTGISIALQSFSGIIPDQC